MNSIDRPCSVLFDQLNTPDDVKFLADFLRTLYRANLTDTATLERIIDQLQVIMFKIEGY